MLVLPAVVTCFSGEESGRWKSRALKFDTGEVSFIFCSLNAMRFFGMSAKQSSEAEQPEAGPVGAALSCRA